MVWRTNPDVDGLLENGLDALDDYEPSVEPVRPDDVRAAFETVSASLSAADVRRFDEWDEAYGSGSLAGEQLD
jgi:hypothetical protein